LYFHYREDGKQKTIYIGKTEEPEDRVDKTLLPPNSRRYQIWRNFLNRFGAWD
jgi:hypothetical protein